MNNLTVLAHCSFLGRTGYNAHSRNFFTHLNKFIPTKVRNYSWVEDLSYLRPEERKILPEKNEHLFDPPLNKINEIFSLNPNDLIVNLVLLESHHYYFYHDYKHPMIAYNVWEATRQMPEYFNRVLEYDQFWAPSEWQRQCTIEQGYPADRVKVVPEGVNGNVFYPESKDETLKIRKNLYKKYNILEETFSFLYFGRWDYRKSTEEVVRAFYEEFGNNDNVVLILSADNPFSQDGMKTTEERLKHYGLESENIKVLHFPPREEYIQWMKAGHVFLSCARSEGWNLPLIESIACGTPSICSNWGAQLEFANGVSYKVDVPTEKVPEQVIFLGGVGEVGVWGEPDFDHLKQVMRKLYNEYSDAKTHALKMSEKVRNEFTWDNAASKAEKIIKELAENYKTVKPPQPFKKMFKTKLEIIGISPKVTFEPLINYKDFLLVRIKDSDGNIKYESWFDDLKVNHSYWISAGSPVDQVTFEVWNDKLDQCLYTETFDEESMGIVEYQEPDQEMELYQDQYVNGEVVVEGKRDCSSRYDAMKEVFEKYNRPFTILDIGANFGYYSIRAATEYDAISVMVENKEGEAKRLVELCEMNACRDKLIVLQTEMNLHKLKELTKCEHFDVVLALNVIHHFEGDDITEVCKTFTQLGDNLILETPPPEDKGSCGQNRLRPIYNYFRKIHGYKLGDFQRHTSDTNSSMTWYETPKTSLKWPYFGYERLFQDKRLDTERLKNRGINSIKSDFNLKEIASTRREEVRDWISGINLKTFIELNGIYPNINLIIEKLKSREIKGDYKWDNSNNDLITHNFVLSGSDLHIIDFDDKLIEEKIFDDKIQVERIINELKQFRNIVDDSPEGKVRINLGCGNDIKPGYINIDKYNNTGNVDIKADLADLPFENNSVDEIYTSHVLEHVGIHEIYSVIEEWRRVLSPNGRLVLRLPNLEHEVNRWLSVSDDRKWSEVGQIFGAQSYKGNSHLCGFNPGSLRSFLERFNFEIKSLELGNYPTGQQIECTAIKKPDTIIEEPPHYICHFVDGPYMEVKGSSNDKGLYTFDFLDPDSESLVHQHLGNINNWTRPNRRYYTNWFVQLRRNGKIVYEHAFDCEGKNVMISMDSRSLGDTIAWMPYTEEFRKKNKCEVWVSSFWNHLFKDHETYKNLNFIEPGTVVDMLYASYMIGCYDNDLNRNKVNWRTVTLQKIACDTLGLDYKEIVTDLGIKPGPRPMKEKYITLCEHSTFQCKYWNRKDGWQIVVDYLNDKGYKVMVISKEKTTLKNVIDRTNRPIEHTITNIYHSELLMGISTGPAWIAWALKVPVVMVSGCTAEFQEFSTNIERVINKDVCNSCVNELDSSFDRGDWNFCPRLKGTIRQFECTKKIEPEVVINAIDKIIKENYKDIKINETNNYFYVPPDNKIKDLNYEVQDFDWINFQQFGPIITAYHEIFIQQDYKHEGCKVEKGDLVVDIGASVGIFTRYAYVNGAKKILSFEAENGNFEYLLKNKPEICSAFNLAVLDNNNIEDLYVSKLEGSHTLLGEAVTDDRELQEIRCVTLNKIFEIHKLDKIDFLKMDIEGSELKAFDGITDENLTKIRKVALEYHHKIFKFDKELREEFIQRFAKLGFRFYILHLRDDHLNMLYFWK